MKRMNVGTRWVDVSVPIRDGMVVWPGNPPVRLQRVLDRARGDPASVSGLSLGVHTGTHVDAPAHFFAGGSGVEAWGFDRLIGPARVVDVGSVREIDAPMVEALTPVPGERLLLRTTNSRGLWRRTTFSSDYVYVTEAAATVLAAAPVRTVGIDYLSIAGPVDGARTHEILLGAGVCIVEGLDLAAVASGAYEMVCLPLRIPGADGAPARALLRAAAP